MHSAQRRAGGAPKEVSHSAPRIVPCARVFHSPSQTQALAIQRKRLSACHPRYTADGTALTQDQQQASSNAYRVDAFTFLPFACAMASMASMAFCTAKPARVTGAATGARVVTVRPLAVPARLRARRSSVAAHASATQFNKPGAVEVKEGKGGLPMVRLHLSSRITRTCSSARTRAPLLPGACAALLCGAGARPLIRPRRGLR